jgi:hypothetical protein
MAAEGIFVGLPRETLEKLRDKAVALILEGKTIMSYGDGVNNASKQFAMPPKEILHETQYALDKLDGKMVRGLWTNYGRQIYR